MPHVASIHSAIPAAQPSRLLFASDAVWRALGALASRLAAWSQAQNRAAVDRDTLVNMSDRHLRDIGLCRRWLGADDDRMWIRDYRY